MVWVNVGSNHSLSTAACLFNPGKTYHAEVWMNIMQLMDNYVI